jgi:hypothetical protein
MPAGDCAGGCIEKSQGADVGEESVHAGRIDSGVDQADFVAEIKRRASMRETTLREPQSMIFVI